MRVKIQKIGGSHIITIPKYIREYLHWEKGDHVDVRIDKSDLSLNISNFKKKMLVKEKELKRAKARDESFNLTWDNSRKFRQQAISSVTK